MTQKEHDRAFNQAFRVGICTLFGAAVAMAVIGLPAFALFGTMAPFMGFAAVGLLGGFLTVGCFVWDISCNPRYKR